MNTFRFTHVALGIALAVPAVACGGGESHPVSPAERKEAREERREEGRWEKLGERHVDGKMDHDVIEVGRADGAFREIEVRVENGSIELFDVVVTFGDGERFSPPTRLVFRPGETTRAIELPGNRRIIRRVDFKYGNLQGGRAHVELFAR